MATYLKHKNCNIRVIFFFLFHHQLKREKTKIKRLYYNFIIFQFTQKIQKKNLNDKLVLNNGKFIEQQSERFVESRLSKLY